MSQKNLNRKIRKINLFKYFDKSDYIIIEHFFFPLSSLNILIKCIYGNIQDFASMMDLIYLEDSSLLM